MFLEKSELKTVSTTEIINLITNGDESIITTIISECIDVMSGYLFQYFDTAAIFEATGDERNLTILKHLKALVIHGIYKRRSKTMNESVKDDYDEAMTWLEKVSEGKIKPPLPIRMVDNGNGGTEAATFLKLGGRKNYENRI
ncbi:DUF1320 domain-containing protein [Flavobacterium sp. N1994]|uniref:DUF1320 domain-containing protein n=1 Tax=Flavobacterium sp. N1994 TaxID=2986827 RepID=UPI00222244E2|nr:DUF1320 domain-containing protein [Flavobacterium sp. N1994]